MENTFNFEEMSNSMDRELDILLTDSKNNQHYEKEPEINDTPDNNISEFMQQEQEEYESYSNL